VPFSLACEINGLGKIAGSCFYENASEILEL